MGILNWWKQRFDLPSAAQLGAALERLVPPVPAPTDDELEEVWLRDGYGTTVHARHILFRVPAEATREQRRAVFLNAEVIRARAVGGEDFATLAREYTMEPGGQHRGGDLGFFGRSRMVEAFERAAFALKCGEISEVVETPFGYHLIKVEERRTFDMHDKAAFRQLHAAEARKKAIRSYLEALKTRASLEVERGAETVVRDLAKRPGQWLWPWQARRRLVRFRSGSLTVGQLAGAFTGVRSQTLMQIANARDEELRVFLQEQASRNLIWLEAGFSYWSPTLRFKVSWTLFKARRIGSAPGSRLLWFADFFYSRKSVEEVLLPTIVDMRCEYNDALAEKRKTKATWVRVRGTWEFLAAALSLTLASIGDIGAKVWNLFRSRV